MGFFAQFSEWLNRILADYVGSSTALVAEAIEPTVVTLAILYVMLWGYAQLAAKSHEPFVAGLRRIFTLGVILGVALHLWHYNTVIVDTFFDAPSALAADLTGVFDSVSIVDGIISAGDDAASLLIRKAGVFNGNFAYYVSGFFVYLIVGVTAVYTIFLLTLSRIALSVLLALGPIFISLLLFETTKRFFESWIAQLANYALITILTTLVAALMMTLVAATAEQAVAAGGTIKIAHAVQLCMASGLTFLVMRQVMPMAAGLASGLALSTFGVFSAAVGWGARGSGRSLGQFARGIGDQQTSRTDPLSRRSGYYLRRGVGRGADQLARAWRTNQIRAR